jgi:hypothetical protein
MTTRRLTTIDDATRTFSSAEEERLEKPVQKRPC